MCQLQCLMNLWLEIAGCTRHLSKGRHQISLQDGVNDSALHKSAGILLVVTFFCNSVAKVVNLGFLNTSKKNYEQVEFDYQNDLCFP